MSESDATAKSIQKLAQKGLDDLLSRLFNVEPDAEVHLQVRFVNGRMYTEAIWRQKADAPFTARVFIADNLPSVALSRLIIDACQRVKDDSEQ